jgi:hypothetical protein
MRLLAALAAHIPAPNCCPHPDLDDDTDAVPADTAHADYRGSVTNG